MSTLNLSVSRGLDSILDDLATARGISRTQVIDRAIRLMKYLDDAAVTSEILIVSKPSANAATGAQTDHYTVAQGLLGHLSDLRQSDSSVTRLIMPTSFSVKP